MSRKKTKKIEVIKSKFDKGEVLVYLGSLYKEYQGQQCICVDSSNDFTKIRFNDNKEHQVKNTTLKRKEEINENN